MIKFFNLVLSKFTFSDDTINGYWVKHIAVKVVTDLEDHFFHQKTKIEKWYLKTVQPLCDPSFQKIDLYDVLALAYFRYEIDHLIS